MMVAVQPVMVNQHPASHKAVLDKNPNGNISEFAKIKQGMQNQGTSSLSTISFAYSDLPIPLQEA